MIQGTPSWFLRVAMLATVLSLHGASAMVVETDPATLPEEMGPGEFVDMTIRVTLDCTELLAARATEPALMSDIGYWIFSDGDSYIGGPSGVELSAPISECYGNETVTLTNAFFVGLTSDAPAFENRSVEINVEPKTSEPLKQTWEKDYWTKTEFINSTSFIFAGGITDIEINKTLIASLNFVNSGNADLHVRPKLVPINGSGDCGTVLPTFGRVEAYKGIDDFAFQFSVVLSEPSVPVVECQVSVDVGVFSPDPNKIRYTLEGPTYTLRPHQEDGQNVSFLSNPFAMVSLGIGVNLIRRAQ